MSSYEISAVLRLRRIKHRHFRILFHIADVVRAPTMVLDMPALADRCDLTEGELIDEMISMSSRIRGFGPFSFRPSTTAMRGDAQGRIEWDALEGQP